MADADEIFNNAGVSNGARSSKEVFGYYGREKAETGNKSM